ncbi:MAG: amidohydrolase family protein [Pseudomonadota bacterium]
MTSWKATLLSCTMAIWMTGCDSESADPSQPRQQADLIVYADHILTMTQTRASITDGAVAIRDGIIVAIEERAQIDRDWVAEQSVDGGNRLLMPGLVNGHTHAAMVLLRGVADDLELMTWLTRFIFPAEVSVVDETFVSVGTTLACYEMIRGGTTVFVDMYYFPDAVANAVVDCGIRALVAPSVIEQTSPDAPDGEQSLAQAVDFITRWQTKHSRIVPVLGAHSVYTISEPWLQRIQRAAAQLHAPISIHVSESRAEIEQIADSYGMTPVQLLDKLEFLSGPLIAAHTVYPDSDDIRTLAARGTGVVHNPTSNMKLASGASPVSAMRNAGVPVGLGTDGAASNNDLDMWEEIRLAGLLAKLIETDPTALPAADVLAMATIEGARAIGIENEIGSLEVGKRADMIQIETDDLMHTPTYDLRSHLVYVSDANNVVTTIVDGRILMLDRTVLTIDEVQLRRDVAAQRDRIITELGLDTN